VDSPVCASLCTPGLISLECSSRVWFSRKYRQDSAMVRLDDRFHEIHRLDRCVSAATWMR
jgi:hypothetical protein